MPEATMDVCEGCEQDAEASLIDTKLSVIPAIAGIQENDTHWQTWIPAYAGMTKDYFPVLSPISVYLCASVVNSVARLG
jgi:hypothetical protein